MNNEHLDVLKQGVSVWNRWRSENPSIKPDLGFARLSECDLRHFNLSGANLKGADFSNTDLRHANLRAAKLGEVIFDRGEGAFVSIFGQRPNNAYFRPAILRNAKLCDANIELADLPGVDLRNADLEGAILKSTRLTWANLFMADLCGAKLENAELDWSDLRSAFLCNASLANANLKGANLSHAYLDGADLNNANLEQSILVETNLEKANLKGCNVYGISAWGLKLDESTQQTDLVITRYGDPIITVDNIEIAQFIYMLLDYKKLHDVINSVIKRGVLILGGFENGGLEILQAIAAKLREIGYLPIIFDFGKPESRNFTETVTTLVGLSRFVIINLNGPSVPQELCATIPHYKVPFVPIIEEGKKPYSMFIDFLEENHVLKPIVKFTSKEQLIQLIPTRVIEPAEEKIKERKELLERMNKVMF